MLAYTVWHHALDEAKQNAYQESLVQFHQTLAENKPQGYLSSVLLSMPGVPWMGEMRTIYMDWYFVENSSSLDPLNDCVLSGIRQEKHDAVAAATSGGVTALYQPKSDRTAISNAQFISWLSKPKGMKYPEFFEKLHFIDEDDHASIWMRYMALGPGPEFCVVSKEEFEWDEKFQAIVRTTSHVKL